VEISWWAEFLGLLDERAERAGCEVVRVSPHYTNRKPPSMHTHVCPHCGHTDGRDMDAAKNILRWGYSHPA